VSRARADLALIGYGNVARRFVTLLEEQREWLARTCDLECRIVGVATRTHGSRFDPRGIDFADLNRDGQQPRAQPPSAPRIIERLGQSAATLRVVIETTTLDIQEGQPAIDHVRAGIAAGCHVVTANKGPVAFAYAELRDAAAAAGVSFLFEGAVMDGVPIFNLVRDTLPAVEILGLRGVINSTTNHILTALERREEFGAALARMQAEGIAEADPSLDIDGWDAAAKVAALANVLMDARITPHDVRRTGIGPLDARRAQDAVARGGRLKLVASAARTEGGGVTASVDAVELPRADFLAALDGKANALVLQTDLLGELAICQLDGNLTQTAYALLSDLVTLRRRQQAPGEASVRRSPRSRARR
jgi:homoserine dehydrogenase